jgi:hypothetical protein
MAKVVSVPISVGVLVFGIGGAGVFATTVPARSESGRSYVGSAACRGCHETEYENFHSFAKKAHSFESIRQMRSRLTPAEFRGCLECHTTGYGRPGGFRSEAETPDLRNAGCEVCHGPGSRHVATADADDIKGKLTLEDCEACHNQERIEAFNFKPMIYGGGH